jgi:hypothetical protein
VVNANGQITIVGITNANKFGWSTGAGGYNGVNYADAITLDNFNQGNLELTPTSIKLKALSTDTKITFRLYNQSNTCFKDIPVTLTPPDCTQEQVVIEEVNVTCAAPENTCKNWTVVAGVSEANIWYLNCTTNAYQLTQANANSTTQICSLSIPLVTGATVTENGVC